MTKNPVINALSASLYIALIVTGIQHFLFGTQDNMLIPIAMLSLFVLSAAVMGYLFLYQPFTLFMAGEHKKAVDFFLATVGSFAVITAIVFVVFYLNSSPSLPTLAS